MTIATSFSSMSTSGSVDGVFAVSAAYSVPNVTRVVVSGFTEEGEYEEVQVPLHTYYLWPHLFLPEETARDPSNPNSKQYLDWAEHGWLRVTKGPVTDFEEVKDTIRQSAEFDLREIGIDRQFQAWQMSQELADEGLPMVEVGAQVKMFSEPMKESLALILLKLIEHNGNPCFTWMLSNVTGTLDRKDNVYPNKEHDRNKIDGPVAWLIALNRAMSDDSGPLFRVWTP